ncbi:MAG: hypothetical protein IKT68_07920 [Clostridia bacterium]|nr:hypothetical protein [Clostridia bacterium]
MGFMDKIKGAAKSVTAVVDQMKEGAEISKRINELEVNHAVHGNTLTTGDGIENTIGFKFKSGEGSIDIERYLVYQATVTQNQMGTVKKYAIIEEFTDDDLQGVAIESVSVSDYSVSTHFDVNINLVLKNETTYSYIESFSVHHNNTYSEKPQLAVLQMEKEREEFADFVLRYLGGRLLMCHEQSIRTAATLFDHLLAHPLFCRPDDEPHEPGHFFEDGVNFMEEFLRLYEVCRDNLIKNHEDILKNITEEYANNQATE